MPPDKRMSEPAARKATLRRAPASKAHASKRAPRRASAPDELDHIEIRGAREHNLKSIDI